MGRSSTKDKTVTISLKDLREAIKKVFFDPRETPMNQFIALSSNRTYLLTRAQEEVQACLNGGGVRNLIFAIRILLVQLVHEVK